MSFALNSASFANLVVGVYARYSTEKQNPLSVEDQVRRCREYVAGRGGVVSDAMVFVDRAESGASLVRGGGIEALLAAVNARRIQAVVVEDISRLSRNLGQGAQLFEEMAFRNVRVIAIADGIDTGGNGSHLHVGMKLLLGSAYLHDLSDKTRRGMTGRAHAGFSTGLLPIGYRSEGPPEGAKRVLIDDERAAIVRRIFVEYAGGRGLASIAAVLNADDVLPPRGNGRRGRPGWVASGIRAVLLNAKYIGRWTFNERMYVKVPNTKRRVAQARPKSEVLVSTYPERRIVSDDLWAATQERFRVNSERYGVEKRANDRSSVGRAGKPSTYLLSGLLVCGACGAPMTISGGATDRRYYYCDANRKRGTCANAVSVRESIARSCILRGLRETIASPVAIAYARKRIAERLGEMGRSADSDARDLRAKLAKHEGRMAKLADAIANGAALDSVLGLLSAEEAAAKVVRSRLAETEGLARAPAQLPSPDELLEAAFNLDERLTGDVEGGREAIRRLLHGGNVRLLPTPEGIYIAEAEVLPLGLFLAPASLQAQMQTPASGDRDGRYTIDGCGGRI